MTHCFIDTHCHFDFPPFSGEETSSIARAAEAGGRNVLLSWAIDWRRWHSLLIRVPAETRDVIGMQLPLTSLLLETDAPDMPLNGFQAAQPPEGGARFMRCVSCVRSLKM